MTTTATKTQSANEAKQGHAAHTGHHARTPGLQGEFLRKIKVVMIGGASHFTHPLMNDILNIEGAPEGEIVLVDTNLKRQEPMREIVERLIAHYGKSEGWSVTATDDRRAAMPGTHYLMNSIDVGGVENIRHDNDIALKYGVDQCIGDTIGPGGLFKAMRTVPVWLDILRDARELCPDALVLNYTNPMSIMVCAAGRAVPEMQVVGLCHSTFLTLNKLAKTLGIDPMEMQYKNAGINHLAWFTELTHRGEDVYPRLFDMVKDREGDAYESDPVRFEMMLAFGAFITESSGHLSEYLPYFRKRDGLIKRFCREGYRGESSFYANNWPTWRENFDQKRDDILHKGALLERPRSLEYASWIIEAREKDSPVRIFGNVMNRPLLPTLKGGSFHTSGGDGEAGKLISNLPADGAVEVACMIDRNGILPTRFGPLPPQMAGVCRTNMSMFDLAATACITKSKEAARHALLLDPLTSAVLDTVSIGEMFEEMFDAQEGPWLEGWA